MSRILVLDDDYDIIKYSEAILRSRGHEVVATTEATRAFELLKTHAFDLVIVDILMPNMNGFDFLKATKKLSNFKSNVLMLTAKSSKDDVVQALKLGATDFIVKPIDHELFTAKIDSVLGKNKSVFATAFTHSKAEITLPTLIQAVSEMGITMKTQNFMDTGVNAKIESELFKEIGIPAPWLRTVSCTPTKNDSAYNYEVAFSFVGLDEKSMQKIRRWVFAKSIASRKAA